jgi:hypothetical protein
MFPSGTTQLNPPGVFALMLNGTEVARGGDFEFYSVTSFGNCECSEDEANFTLATWSNFKPADWSLLKKNTLTPYTGLKLVASEDSFFTVVDECIPKDCYYLSSQQSSRLQIQTFRCIDVTKLQQETKIFDYNTPLLIASNNNLILESYKVFHILMVVAGSRDNTPAASSVLIRSSCSTTTLSTSSSP